MDEEGWNPEWVFVNSVLWMEEESESFPAGLSGRGLTHASVVTRERPVVPSGSLFSFL